MSPLLFLPRYEIRRGQKKLLLTGEGFAKCFRAGAVGVNDERYREILGIAEGSREDKEAWSSFLRYLKHQHLQTVRGGLK